MPNKIALLSTLVHKTLDKFSTTPWQAQKLHSCCPLCQIPQAGSKFCQYCYDSLVHPIASCCCCAEPLPDFYSDDVHSLRCGRCQTTPPIFDQVITRLLYTAPLSKLIQSFKFNGNLVMLPCLVDCLEQQLHRSIELGYHLPEAVIAVPLHPKRLRKRGFNQSQLIAKTIAKTFSLEVLSHCVQRTKLTGEQASLNRKQRHSNMKNAFKVSKSIEINSQAVKHIAIIDDVITSGSTCNELAKTLKSTGVTIVDVWCIAKTPFIK